MSDQAVVEGVWNLGAFAENAFLIICKRSGKALLVDPGDGFAQIKQMIEQQNVSLQAIYLTHTHVDHVQGLAACIKEWPVPLFLPEQEVEMYEGLPQQCQMFSLPVIEPTRPYTTFTEGDDIRVGELCATIWHTPGHSPGSSSFYFKEQNWLIAGDLLFSGSIGRMDLWGGDSKAMEKSLERVCQLPANVEVYPGHGPATTIGREVQSNPFLQGPL